MHAAGGPAHTPCAAPRPPLWLLACSPGQQCGDSLARLQTGHRRPRIDVPARIILSLSARLLRSNVRDSDQPAFAGQRLFLMGISMGGCVAAHAALKRPDLFSGAVLLAPMLSLEKVAKAGLNPYLR